MLLLESMKKVLILKYLFVSSVMLFNIALADVPPEQVREVSHLLDFVRNSQCIINRNGTDYPAEKGVAHIEKKYDYFRDDINSTEDFIEYSATKSTMSGDYYTVTCPGKQTIKTQDWLLEELQQFRSKQK